MARENQGYLIGIICLSVLSVGLIVATVLGWAKASEYNEAKVAAETKLKTERALADSQRARANIFEAMISSAAEVSNIGSEADSIVRLKRSAADSDKSKFDQIIENVEAVRQIYDADMKGNSTGAEADAQERTYKNLISNLNAVLAKKHRELIVRTRANAAYRAETDTKLAQAAKKIDALEEAVQGKDRELQDTIANAQKNEAGLKNIMASQLKNQEDVNRERAREQEVAKEKAAQLAAGKAKVEDENSTLKKKVDEYERVDFTIADGSIVRVEDTPGNRRVVINRGLDDGLKTGRSFSVFDAAVSNFELEKAKAAINVVRLIGRTAAVATITDDDATNPILEGDKILSPTWDPGQRVRFALAGNFFLDDDFTSDYEALRRDIELNGGEVVVFHDENGNITGEIDPSIRFLVLGESPLAPVEGVKWNPEVGEAMKIMEQQAENNAVQVIGLTKLLNWMGRHGRPKIQAVAGPADGFDPRGGSGAKDGSGSKDGSGAKDGSSTR